MFAAGFDPWISDGFEWNFLDDEVLDWGVWELCELPEISCSDDGCIGWRLFKFFENFALAAAKVLGEEMFTRVFCFEGECFVSLFDGFAGGHDDKGVFRSVENVFANEFSAGILVVFVVGGDD